jgi:hypothetical protein
LVGYSCFSSLFYVAFAKPANAFHIALDWVVEAHFYLDLVLSFFCEYLDPETNTPVRDVSKIALHYLQSWFMIDFVSVFPFDQAFGDTGGFTKLLRLARLPRLVKLIDVQRFKSILKSF